MVEYACDCRSRDAEDRLQVEGESEAVRFGVRPEVRQESEVDVFLRRDAVAALVGQLTAWLDRTRDKG